MNVFFLSDDKFAEIFAVALESLYAHQKHTKDLRVFLIENGVSSENKNKLNMIASRYDRRIEYIAMPDIYNLIGASLYIPNRLNVVDYARLMVEDVLPTDVDRVIQLDCDLILRHSIDELWEFDLGINYCGMTNEGHNKQMRRVLHIAEDGMYFNSGVVLINLKKWRENHIQEMFVQYIQKMNGYVPINAQGVMNAVMNGKISVLPAKYNVTSLMYSFSYEELIKLRRPKYYYSKAEYEEALRDPVIVHYLTCFYLDVRPWMKGCVHPMLKEFLKYREKTPYAQFPLWEQPSHPVRQLYINMCHALPKPVAVWMSSLVYTYYLPTKHVIMERVFKMKNKHSRRGTTPN